MRLRVCTGPVARRCFYAISMNYLRMFCELLMLFVQKNRTVIYGMHPTWGLGCWTGGLTDKHGRGLTWCTQAWGMGGHAGAGQLGREAGQPGLPRPFSSLRLPVLIHIERSHSM
jgi:hypothetical protein